MVFSYENKIINLCTVKAYTVLRELLMIIQKKNGT